MSDIQHMQDDEGFLREFEIQDTVTGNPITAQAEQNGQQTKTVEDLVDQINKDFPTKEDKENIPRTESSRSVRRKRTSKGHGSSEDGEV